MAPSPSPEPERAVAATVAGYRFSAEKALAFGKKTERVYVPRIIHADWKSVMHVIVGVASHIAWCILALKYKQIRLRGYDKFKEHKQLTGSLIRTWVWELLEQKIKEDLEAVRA